MSIISFNLARKGYYDGSAFHRVVPYGIIQGGDPLLKDAKKPVRCINSAGGYAFFNPTDIAANKKHADYNAVFIESVGHYPMLEKPAEFNQKLREVLKEFAAK